jgi:predicted nucleic acid-binding Zn ribbon protein
VSDETPETEGRPPHDENGLDLARAVARSMAGGKRRRPGAAKPSTRRRSRSGDAVVSGAHPDDRDPQTLDATIDRLVNEHGWSTDVAVHGVFSRWDTIVGAEVAQHCRPERYSDARLAVRADSTAWATQMRMLAPTVVRRLNEELGEDSVSRIEVLGPNVPSWSKGGRGLKDARGPRDTYG